MKKVTKIRAVPRRFAGKWIAWDRDCRQIVASGRTFEEAINAARKAGETDPVFDKVPQGEGWFVGTTI